MGLAYKLGRIYMPKQSENDWGESTQCFVLFRKLCFAQCERLLLCVPVLHQTTLTSPA